MSRMYIRRWRTRSSTFRISVRIAALSPMPGRAWSPSSTSIWSRSVKVRLCFGKHLLVVIFCSLPGHGGGNPGTFAGNSRVPAKIRGSRRKSGPFSSNWEWAGFRFFCLNLISRKIEKFRGTFKSSAENQNLWWKIWNFRRKSQTSIENSNLPQNVGHFRRKIPNFNRRIKFSTEVSKLL